MKPQVKINILPSPRSTPPKSAKRSFFTTSQLSRRWGISVATVIRLIEEGQLTGLKIRGIYRVSHDSIVSYERKVAF